MHIPVIITTKEVFSPCGWEIALCPCCEQYEACRVEDVDRVRSIYFIRMSSERVGRLMRCDFCERVLAIETPVPETMFDEWTPSMGLATLVAKIEPGAEFSVPDKHADARLRSLLLSAREAASFRAMNVGLGIVGGLITGGALGLPIGLGLFDLGVLSLRTDRFGHGALFVLLGLPLGAILGGMLEVLLKKKAVVRRKLRRACSAYGLDVQRLRAVADDFPSVVRNAVEELQVVSA